MPPWVGTAPGAAAAWAHADPMLAGPYFGKGEHHEGPSWACDKLMSISVLPGSRSLAAWEGKGLHFVPHLCVRMGRPCSLLSPCNFREKQHISLVLTAWDGKCCLNPSACTMQGTEGSRRVVEMPRSLQVTSKAWRGGCRPGGHAQRPAKLCAAPSRVPFSRGHCVSVHSPPGHGGMSSPWLGQAWTSSLPGSPLPLLPDSPRLGAMESLGLVRGRRRRSPQRLANLDQTAGNPLSAVQEDLESAGPAGGRPRQTGSCLTGQPGRPAGWASAGELGRPSCKSSWASCPAAVAAGGQDGAPAHRRPLKRSARFFSTSEQDICQRGISVSSVVGACVWGQASGSSKGNSLCADRAEHPKGEGWKYLLPTGSQVLPQALLYHNQLRCSSDFSSVEVSLATEAEIRVL